MKKFLIAISALACLSLVSCKEDVEIITKVSDTVSNINYIDIDDSVKVNQKVDGQTGVIVVNGAKVTKRFPINIDLSSFANSEVCLDFSCDFKVTSSEDALKINFLLNDPEQQFPKIADKRVKVGEWTRISGQLITTLNGKRSIYLASSGMDVSNMKFYLKNFKVKVTAEKDNSPKETFDVAPSIREAYEGKFDYVGLAIGKGELTNKTVQGLLTRHASCITMGNEFKPDFTFAWQQPKKFVDFVAEDGKTYQMPEMISMRDVKACLQAAKDCGLIMRGHVLVWHSQTPKFFFTKDWADKGDYVSKAEMTAREEWYIKYVLDYVRTWEEENNDGNHIIRYWDVVNEAMSDSAGGNKWLREDSDWYRIYGDETFIINAFRFANKYAPADVQLVYNDYNSFMGQDRDDNGKHGAILRIIDEIKATPDARIDAVGMQSHVKIDWPAVYGKNSFESAVQNFLEKGVDVQITELDIANGDAKYSALGLKQRYKDYYTLALKYAKKDGKNGISGVTVWGLNDETTWLNALAQYKGKPQFPLLFTGSTYKTKPAFYGVIEAATEN